MSYLIDTSVWISYFRVPAGPLAIQVDELLRTESSQVVACPPVRMELAVEDDELRRRRILRIYDNLQAIGIVDEDFDAAAALFRACRRQGHTIRSKVDCLIAATALRADATLVHRDTDFDRMSEIAPYLTVLRLPDD
jgi:predicted nucleic acid-binding protein